MITKLELKRQISHILLGVILIGLLTYDMLNSWILFIASFIVLGIAYSTKIGYKVWPFYYFLEHLGRDSEKKYFPAKGLFFYLLGSGLSLLFFDKKIALASIAILALGDSISRLVGPYGYLKHPYNSKKFIEGVIAGFVVASIGAMFYVQWYLAVPAAFFAMFLEGLDIEVNNFKVDDNLTIPLVSGGTMLAIQAIIAYF